METKVYRPQAYESLKAFDASQLIAFCSIMQEHPNDSGQLYLLIRYFSIVLPIDCNEPVELEDDIIKIFLNIFVPTFIQYCLSPSQNYDDDYALSLLFIGKICYYAISRKNFEILKAILNFLILHNEIQINSFDKRLETNWPSLFSELEESNIANKGLEKEIRQESNTRFRMKMEHYDKISNIFFQFYQSGVLFQIRKYLCSCNIKHIQNDDIDFIAVLNFLDKCNKYICIDYRNYFIENLLSQSNFNNDDFQTIISLRYARILMKFSLNLNSTKKKLINYYFHNLIFLLNSEDNHKDAIAEFDKIQRSTNLSEEFLHALANTFINSLNLFENDANTAQNIINFLSKYGSLSSLEKEIFDKCSKNNNLMNLFFDLLSDFINNDDNLKNQLIDNIYNNDNTLNNTTKTLMIKVLKKMNPSHLSENLTQIFTSFLLNNSFTKEMIEFSNYEKYKSFLRNAIIFILQSQNFAHINLYALLEITQNINLEIDNNCKEILADKLFNDIDSLFIPIIIEKFSSYLEPLNPELFWELSVHNSLFFKIVNRSVIKYKDFLLNKTCFIQTDFCEELLLCLINLYDQTKELEAFFTAVYIYDTISPKIPFQISSQLKNKLINIFQQHEKNDKLFYALIKVFHSNQNSEIKSLESFLTEMPISLLKFNSIAFNQNDIKKEHNPDIISLYILNCEIDDYILNTCLQLLDQQSKFALYAATTMLYNHLNLIQNFQINFTNILARNSDNINVNTFKNIINIMTKLNYYDSSYFSISNPLIYKIKNLEIVELIFQNIHVSNSFISDEQFLSFLLQCTNYQQFTTIFKCILSKQPLDEQLAPIILTFLTNEIFPSFMINDSICSATIKTISNEKNNSIQFLNYLAGFAVDNPDQSYSLYRPKTKCVLLQIFSNLLNYLIEPDMLQDQEVSIDFKEKILPLLINIRFSAQYSLPTNFNESIFKSETRTIENQIMEILELFPEKILNKFESYVLDYKTMKIIKSIFFPIYNKRPENDNNIVFNLIKSSLDSKIIFKNPEILLIKLPNKLIHSTNDIEFEIDLSLFSANSPAKYSLNSIYSSNGYAYIKYKTGFISCSPNDIVFTNSITFLNDVPLLIYTKQSNDLNTFMKDDFYNFMITNNVYKQIHKDNTSTLLRIFNNEEIDWCSFNYLGSVFYDFAATILSKFKIIPLFIQLENNSDFSRYVFSQRTEIFFNQDFTNYFSKNIINLANSFEEKEVLLCYIIYDIMPKNLKISFTLLCESTFPLEIRIFSLSLISSYYRDDNEFDKYLDKILYDEAFYNNDKLIQDLLSPKENYYIITFLLKKSDSHFIQYLSISEELFNQALKYSNPQFIMDILSKFSQNNEYIKYIETASEKLYDQKSFQDLVCQQFEKGKIELNPKFLYNLFLASDQKFITIVLKYFEHTNHNNLSKFNFTEFSPLLIKALKENSINCAKLYEFVLKYIHNFSPYMTQIGNTYLYFLISKCPAEIVNFNEIYNFVFNSSQPDAELFGNCFSTFKNNNFNKWYSQNERDALFILFFKFLENLPINKKFGHFLTFSDFVKYSYTNISDKKIFYQSIQKLVKDDLSLLSAFNLVSTIFDYPQVVIMCIEKLCELNVLKNSMGFSFLILKVLNMISRIYYPKKYLQTLYYSQKPDFKSQIFLIKVINQMLEDHPLSINCTPTTSNYDNNITSMFILFNFLNSYFKDNSSYEILKYFPSEYKLEYLRLYKNCALIFPDVLKNIINYPKIVDLFSLFDNLSERVALSNFVCELFQKCFGNSQIIPTISNNEINFAFNFFFQFALKYLKSSPIEFSTMKPFLDVIISILCIVDEAVEIKNKFLLLIIPFIQNNTSVIFNLINNISFDETNNEIFEKEKEELINFFTFLTVKCKLNENDRTQIFTSISIQNAILSIKKRDKYLRTKFQCILAITKNVNINLKREILCPNIMNSLEIILNDQADLFQEFNKINLEVSPC